jgi:hypothetical protein
VNRPLYDAQVIGDGYRGFDPAPLVLEDLLVSRERAADPKRATTPAGDSVQEFITNTGLADSLEFNFDLPEASGKVGIQI